MIEGLIWVFIVLSLIFSAIGIVYAWMDAQDKMDESIRLEKRYEELED